MKTSGRMLPATIRLARPVEPWARPRRSAPKALAAAGRIPLSIMDPIDPAYATSSGVSDPIAAAFAAGAIRIRTSIDAVAALRRPAFSSTRQEQTYDKKAGLMRNFRTLERDTRGRDHRMVVCRMMGDGDLVSGAEGQTDAIVQRDASDDNPGGDKELTLAGVLPEREPRVIKFQLRPEIFQHAILQRRVPVERHRQTIHSAVRNCDP